MITCSGIHKSFGSLEVIRGVDLSVGTSEVTAIVGPSGAGKTTLLQILGTLDRPGAGTVRYGDVDPFALRPAALARFRNRNRGLFSQFPPLRRVSTPGEIVGWRGLRGAPPRREAFARASELVAMLGLKERAAHRPGQLSGGECQRAAVARALVNTPQVVLADEPSGSLDSANRAELHRIFFDLRDRLGATFVIVTHDESLAADCDRVIHMRDGLVTSISSRNEKNQL